MADHSREKKYYYYCYFFFYIDVCYTKHTKYFCFFSLFFFCSYYMLSARAIYTDWLTLQKRRNNVSVFYYTYIWFFIYTRFSRFVRRFRFGICFSFMALYVVYFRLGWCNERVWYVHAFSRCIRLKLCKYDCGKIGEENK